MRLTTAIQPLTSIPRATTPNPNTGDARLLCLLPVLMIAVPLLVLVSALVLVLLRLATGIHHIAIPILIPIFLKELPIETQRAQTLQLSSQSASIQRVVYSRQRRILLSKN